MYTSIILGCCCACLITSSLRHIATWQMLSHYRAHWHIRTFLFKWTMVSMALLQDPRGPHCNPSIWAFRDSLQNVYPRWIPPATLYLQDHIIQSVCIACFMVWTCCTAFLLWTLLTIGSLPDHSIKGWRSSSECVLNKAPKSKETHQTLCLFLSGGMFEER